MLPSDLQTDALSQDDALESLADLERNKPDAVKGARSASRIRIKSTVIAQPGNSGDRLKTKIHGVTGDVSVGGCQVLFPIPLRVGDIYWLSFDRNDLDIDSVFGRCLRCRLIREDAYEVGFSFFPPIDMSNAIESQNVDSLFE